MATQMEPLITNERAKREWDYIVTKVGEERARAAIAQIPGNRRPYPLNIARVLGIRFPESVTNPPASREVALKHLEEIRKKFFRSPS